MDQGDGQSQINGFMMPGTILFVLFGGIVVMTLMMACRPKWRWWKATLVSLLVGVVLIPVLFWSLPFWAAFYTAWLSGVLLGSVPGATAREERLTALLLIVGAALASWPMLIPYKGLQHWVPPWNAEDVYTIAFLEFFNLAIFTWLAAALMLVVLALLIAAPVNLFLRPSLDVVDGGPGGTREAVNTWFKDRFEIVFGILGVVSFVGSSRAEREQAKLRYGAYGSGSDPDHPGRRARLR